MFTSVLNSIAYNYNFSSNSNYYQLFSKSDLKIKKKIASDFTIHITKTDKGSGVVVINLRLQKSTIL